jgi:hypothetical protein
MGFAGTMGAGNIMASDDGTDRLQGTRSGDSGYFESMDTRFIDYAIVDEIACPKKLICGQEFDKEFVEAENAASLVISHKDGQSGDIRLDDDSNRIYTERLIYMPQSYFVNDHKQGFREPMDPFSDSIIPPGARIRPLSAESYLSNKEQESWTKEQIKRITFRRNLFPDIREDTIIYANFNQLYKIDPEIFDTWLQILKRVPNSILWLLRFPPAGEFNLRKRAVEVVGEQVAKRIVFTGMIDLSKCLDVAAKEVHIHRGRIADVFLGKLR